MSPPEARLRAELVDYCHRLHARGWVANHDGNLSARLADGRFLCTPTATSKAEVHAESLLIVDASGARVSGRAKPFSEIGLHMCIYKQRPDVQAVVHAHPPHATALAASGRCLDQPFLAEAVVSLITAIKEAGQEQARGIAQIGDIAEPVIIDDTENVGRGFDDHGSILQVKPTDQIDGLGIGGQEQ